MNSSFTISDHLTLSTREESTVRERATVHVHGFTSWTYASSRRRLYWAPLPTAAEPNPAFYAIDGIPSAHTLVDFSVQRATRRLRHAVDGGKFVQRGTDLAAAIGTTVRMPAIMTVTVNAPWAAPIRNFATTIANGSALVGPRAGAPDDYCAACAQFGCLSTDSVLHMIGECEVATALRRWAVPILLRLLGLGDDDTSDDAATPFSMMGFARLLAHGGDHDMLRHPACMAVRGACLSALRTARNEAHAMHDDEADRALRRADTDITDAVLGVLPALATTEDVDGWNHERAVAHATRDLMAHVTTDMFVASGAYIVHPDCAQIKTLRPTSPDELERRWGSICDFPPDYMTALGAQVTFTI